MDKPKVLVFTDWFEPGYKAGGPIRSVVNLVRSLADKIDFFVVTGDRDFGENQPYDSVTLGTWTQKEGYKVYYVPQSAFKPIVFLKILKEKDYNSIYLNSLFSLKFTLVPLLLLRLKNKADKIILAPRGMLRIQALEIKKKKKQTFLKFAENTGLYGKLKWHVTSIEEKNEIKFSIPETRIFNIPNLSIGSLYQPKREKKKLKVQLVFISRIVPTKNIRYFLDILKDLSIVKGELEFDIYGPVEDKNYWNSCLSLMGEAGKNIRIKYKGELAYHEVAKVLGLYHFFVLPTKNENYGHAIVEAALAGCVPIISNQTPWRNLEASNAGWDLDLSCPEDFKKVITYCLHMEDAEYQHLSESCKSYFLKKVSDKKILEDYMKMFNQSVK